MIIVYIVMLIGVTINIILPLRHKHSRYFYYFFIKAITDISALVLIFVFDHQPNNFSLLWTIYLPISLFYDFFKKNLLIMLILCLFLAYPILSLDAQTSLELQHPFDIAIVFILLWQSSKMYLKESTINLFSFGILLYAIAEFLALIGFIIDIETNTSVIINYIASFSQILIGLFLLTFSENNPKVIFRVSK